MDAMECIKTRVSVRSYRPDQISEEVIREILEAATAAPSSGNVQDWEFIVVRNPEGKRRLSEAAYGQDFINEAPVVVVVCSDLKKISGAYGIRGESLYSIQNTAAAIQNLMLAAWSKGIGSCWVGAFNEERVRGILVLPSYVRPLAIITLGYPDKKPNKPERRDLKEVVHFERY